MADDQNVSASKIEEHEPLSPQLRPVGKLVDRIFLLPGEKPENNHRNKIGGDADKGICNQSDEHSLHQLS